MLKLMSGVGQVFCKWRWPSFPLVQLCFSLHRALANVSRWRNNESNGWTRKELGLNTAYRRVPGPLLNSAQGEGSAICHERSRLFFFPLTRSFPACTLSSPLSLSLSFFLSLFFLSYSPQLSEFVNLGQERLAAHLQQVLNPPSADKDFCGQTSFGKVEEQFSLASQLKEEFWEPIFSFSWVPADYKEQNTGLKPINIMPCHDKSLSKSSRKHYL